MASMSGQLDTGLRQDDACVMVAALIGSQTGVGVLGFKSAEHMEDRMAFQVTRSVIHKLISRCLRWSS